mgnify:CR=1 FL=1
MNIKDELRYAFWMAFALFIWSVIEYAIGIQTGAYFEYLPTSVTFSTLLVVGAGMYMAMKNTKAKTEASELKYGTLAISGGIALVACAILSFGLTAVFYNFINTEWLSFMTDQNLALLEEPPSPERMAELKEGYAAHYSAGSMGMQTFSRIIMFGLILLFLEALIVLKIK